MKRPPKKPPSGADHRRPHPVADDSRPAAPAPLASDPKKPAGGSPKPRPTKPPMARAGEGRGATVKRRPAPDHDRPDTSDIGFKKPPKGHSWQKGQSGNPKGRKKGSRNKRTIIISLMEGRLGRKIPDPRKLTAQEAMLWKAIQKGLAGDAKAMAFAFKRYDDATASSFGGPVITTEEDQQVYDALRAKIRQEIEDEQ